MGPVALSKALPDYDETVNQLQGQSLLLNIARSRHFMTPHFTDTTSIVATFDFTTSASAGATFPSGNFSKPGASLGAGVATSENPTIELSPLRGEEFAQQILTPLSDTHFRLLATEGLPLDMLIRLMGKAFSFQAESGEIQRTVRNNPDIPEEYEEFRRIALHLSSLNDRGQLFARQLSFIHSDKIILSVSPTAADIISARNSGFEYIEVGVNQYCLAEQIIGNSIGMNPQEWTGGI